MHKIFLGFIANFMTNSLNNNNNNNNGSNNNENNTLHVPQVGVSRGMILAHWRFYEGMKSTVEEKESLLDKVAEEETELELILEGLDLSRKKRVDSRSNKVRKAQSTRSMAGVDEGKRPVSGEGSLLAFSTTGSGEVARDKRRVEPSGESGEKAVEGRSVLVDDLKEVEERAKLAILQGKEDTSQMVKAKANLDEMVEERDRLGHHLMLMGYSQEKVDTIKADTYVEVEDEEVEVVGVMDGLDGVSCQIVLDNQGDDVELPEGESKNVFRETSLRINDLESGLAREKETSKALLSAQAELLVRIEHVFDLQVKLDSSRAFEDNVLMCNREFAEKFDRMKKANESREDQFVKAHFRLEKLNQAVSDLTLQVEVKDSEIKKALEELFEATKHAEKLQRQRRCDDLKERIARLKAERDQVVARAKKVEARERSGGSRTEVKARLVRGDVVSLSGHIRELESDVSQIQGHVQKGNANLRECQHKLDAALIREKILEGEIKANELFRARVVDLQAINLAESAKYIAKLEEDAIYHDRVDAEIIEWKDNCARLKSRLERLKAKFATGVVPGVSRSDLLRMIVTYFVEEVKKLESERDTLFKTLSDKGCICGAKIDRGNCMGTMETQLGPRTAESIEQGRVAVARELKERPLDDVGESIVDALSAEKNLL
ncbi:hypothetical protein GIB67_034927 [Kingdonia uniflora]|uniref:Uncharacterized protein n=1 Tax=Kingdonia uniflora TaxID=39325 RepID=A0A7J7NGR3_9MAGN|nr:hypothetical protein GIB67_034927 [Kingdonia uniflora]